MPKPRGKATGKAGSQKRSKAMKNTCTEEVKEEGSSLMIDWSSSGHNKESNGVGEA